MGDVLEFKSASDFAGSGWSAKRIVIGRVVMEDVSVSSHQGTMHLNNALAALIEKTRRRKPAHSRYAEPLPAGTPARLLSEEAADFAHDMERRKLSPLSATQYQRAIRLLMLASGDIPVSEITAGHINQYLDVLRWWPANAGKSKRYRGLSDQQILELGKQSNRPPPAQATLDAGKRYLATFFNRLLKMRVIAFSPLEAFGDIGNDLVDVKRRRPFEQSELCALFEPSRFAPWANAYPHRWWAPMIALYTGARASEIAQLKVADILYEEGVWCVAFRKTLDDDLAGGDLGFRTRQRLKGKHSIRTVPLAQPLLDAGFLDFLEDARKTKHPRLFPHLPAGICKKTGQPNGAGYGASLSGAFSRFLKRECGMDKGVVFHAFRHLFVTCLEEADVAKELIASMTGHAVIKTVPVMQTFYSHMRPAVLRQRQVEALAKFDPGVQLPKYRKGQFARAYGADARLHP